MARKRRTAIFRITLLVRGKEIVREFNNETDWRKWQETYERQISCGNGVESMRTDVEYR